MTALLAELIQASDPEDLTRSLGLRHWSHHSTGAVMEHQQKVCR